MTCDKAFCHDCVVTCERCQNDFCGRCSEMCKACDKTILCKREISCNDCEDRLDEGDRIREKRLKTKKRKKR